MLPTRGESLNSFFYEQSGPDRFQFLVQSLLQEEYEHLRCFPVGEADGGRDAWDPATKTVAQVKFKRSDEKVSAASLIATLEKELPKIERLIARGAERYLFVTNAKGTSSLDSGVQDKVDAWLRDNVRIAASSMWRTDLDRRFEKSLPALRLRYSEVLGGDGAIQLVLEGLWGADGSRRMAALRAYSVYHFRRDSDLKFKQVDQNNELLSLFVDVPLGLSVLEAETILRRRDVASVPNLIEGLEPAQLLQLGRSGGAFFSQRIHRSEIGSATALLRGSDDTALRAVVLQGAPGQGKSTISQYVCQVHRAKMLESTSFTAATNFLEQIDGEQKSIAFRLPFKIDARDLSGFLEQAAERPRTVEEFIAQAVRASAGGMAFDVDDLYAVLITTPIMLFVDGLDEVADFSHRQHLVDEVSGLLDRFAVNSADIQTIVTTRPSLFGNAPSFGPHHFVTFELGDLPLSIVRTYAGKWVEARRLDEADATELRQIFEEKLSLGHIADLTRNPMQLTILLALVHRVGYSLPDQRTDLYKQYVELFVTREAEKSRSVRQYRGVLLGFIQHLAWLLQVAADSRAGSGSITGADLRSELRAFLSVRGYDASALSDVFVEGVERVYVLVERVEGEFEFEVQPLREYFCARYIYETAPSGTFRDARPAGDKGKRFESLARAPFWSNVTRFYAGSYEIGEIADIVMSLEQLLLEDSVAVRLQARRIGFALLQDRVLSARKYEQDKLVRLLCDAEGIDLLCAEFAERSEPFVLDVACGQATLSKLLLEAIARDPSGRRAMVLANLLRVNGGDRLSAEFAELTAQNEGALRTQWLQRLVGSGAVRSLEPSVVWDLCAGDDPGDAVVGNRCAYVLSAEASDDVPTDARVVGAAFVAGRDGHLTTPVVGPTSTALVLGMLSLAGVRYISYQLLPGSVAEVQLQVVGADPIASAASRIANEIAESIDVGDEEHFFVGSGSLLTASLAWERFYLGLGDGWGVRCLALASYDDTESSMLRGRTSRGLGLFSASIEPNLAIRAALVARRRSAKLWRGDLGRAGGTLDRMTWALLLLSAAPAAVIEQLLVEIESVLAQLSDTEFSQVIRAIRSESQSQGRSGRQLSAEAQIPGVRTFLALATRWRWSPSLLPSEMKASTEPELKTWQRGEEIRDRVKRLPALSGRSVSDADVDEWLDACAEGAPVASAAVVEHRRTLSGRRIERRVAERVLGAKGFVPLELTKAAVRGVSRTYRARGVGATADVEGWAFF